MYDIHHHLLFGVDDGPKDLESSLTQAEASIGDGVTHIVCTPHSNDEFAFRPDVCREQMAIIEHRLGGRLALGLGCDFHLSFDNIDDAFRNRTKYTINGKQYLLVEFPEMAIPYQISDIFCRFIAMGILPILTHPERNQVLKQHPERMVEWLRAGCLVQVTAASLEGRFGKRSEELSLQFLSRNWVHFIASDAHNTEGRAPRMGAAYRYLEGKFGKATADRLCIENPRAAFWGEPLPIQPKPTGLMEEPKAAPKRGLLRSIFRR